MVRKLTLDLLPRNLEFHNLSHVTLTPAHSGTLGLGLKFKPTLTPPAARVFDNQIQDICRSVRLHHKSADQCDDPGFNSKLYVKSGWNPQLQLVWFWFYDRHYLLIDQYTVFAILDISSSKRSEMGRKCHNTHYNEQGSKLTVTR